MKKTRSARSLRRIVLHIGNAMVELLVPSYRTRSSYSLALRRKLELRRIQWNLCLCCRFRKLVDNLWLVSFPRSLL